MESRVTARSQWCVEAKGSASTTGKPVDFSTNQSAAAVGRLAVLPPSKRPEHQQANPKREQVSPHNYAQSPKGELR